MLGRIRAGRKGQCNNCHLPASKVHRRKILFVYALHAGAWNAEYDGCPEKNRMQPWIGLSNHSGGIVDEASCSHNRFFWYSV